MAFIMLLPVKKNLNLLTPHYLADRLCWIFRILFSSFFARFREELGISKIIGLDNFISGYPQWITELEKQKDIVFYDCNVIADDIQEIPEADKVVFVFCMASIASPAFYHTYPIETLDANIWGLRNLLEFYKNLPIEGFLFFSTSEIYRNPDPKRLLLWK